jgi:hypothetical protein
MMKPTHLLSAAMILVLISNISFAQGADDCRLKCAGEKDSRNAQCPVALYDDPDSTQARDQCLKNNQAAYSSCVSNCPAPSSNPGPSGEPAPSPAPMGY